ncbi:MAG: hypothetical protein Q8L12_03720 [Methylibium sp.]|nr:hypothetical protein [Methylibium sp.]
MNDLILRTIEDGDLLPAATVKESLTVHAESGRAPTAEKSSVVQKEQP